MKLTCATSTSFPAVLLPSGSHLWITSPQIQADKQNYITGGPAKPMSHEFDNRELNLRPHIYHEKHQGREGHCKH